MSLNEPDPINWIYKEITEAGNVWDTIHNFLSTKPFFPISAYVFCFYLAERKGINFTSMNFKKAGVENAN